MPPSIQKLTHIYELQHTRGGIHRSKIIHDNYININQTMRRLYNKFTAAQISLQDNEVYTKFRHLRFRIRHYPLPFNHHHVICHEIIQLIDTYWDAYPYMHDELDAIKNQVLPQIIQSEDNPIYQRLKEINTSVLSIMLYRNNNLIRDVEQMLQHDRMSQHMQILSETQYLDLETYDHVAVVGSPGLFRDAIFQSARTNRMTVVYTIGASANIPHAHVLGDYPQLPNTPKRQIDNFVDNDTMLDDDISPPSSINWKRITQEIVGDTRIDANTGIVVSANVLQFEDDYYTFVDAAPSEGIQALDISRLSGNRGEGLYLLKRRDMRPGLYVLLRTDGDTDYVEKIANQILSTKARNLRDQLSEWKDKFGIRIKVKGIDKICNLLLENGATATAKNPMNVMRWADVSNIKPQDNRDFRAVLIIAGYTGAEIDQIMSNARLIADAHIQAGQLVRKKLRELISKQQINARNVGARIDFVLPEIGAQLSAFRIEEVSTDRADVARWRVHKLFRITN
jgi:hypothetical protein